jgi:hypothetical protein
VTDSLDQRPRWIGPDTHLVHEMTPVAFKRRDDLVIFDPERVTEPSCLPWVPLIANRRPLEGLVQGNALELGPAFGELECVGTCDGLAFAKPCRGLEARLRSLN